MDLRFYNYIRRMPFIRILFALILGTILGNYFEFPKVYILSFALVLGLATLIVNNSFIRGLFLSMVWMAIADLNVEFNRLEKFTYFTQEKVPIIASVDEEIRHKKDKDVLTLKFIKIGDSLFVNKSWRFLVSVSNDSNLIKLNYGDRVCLYSQINPIKNFGNPGEFDYKRYLFLKKIVARSYIQSKDIIKISGFSGSYLKYKAITLRQYLIKKFKENGIKGQNLAILSALSLGYKSDLERDTKALFAHTGAMHVLAVSGLHVGIIYTILIWILSKIPAVVRKYIQFPLLLIGIWFFAIISGLAPSVTRASLMLSFVALFRLTNRESNIYNTIFIAAFFQIVGNPFVIFDVGFQLSYLAVLSIISLQPIIAGFFEIKNKWLRKIWELTAVSIAAMIGTLPVGLFYFHQFPVYFIVANLVIVPLAGILLQIAVAFFLVSWLAPLAQILAYVLKWGIYAMYSFVELIGNMPASVITNISFKAWEIVFVIVLIVLIFSFIQFKYFKLLKYSLSVLVLYLSIILGIQLYGHRQSKFVVYNSPKTSAYQLFEHGESFIYHNADSAHAFFVNNMLLQNASDEYTILRNTRLPVFFRFKKYLIGNIQNEQFNDKISSHKLKLDYLILSKFYKNKLSDLKKLFVFKKIVIDSSVPDYQVKKWLAEAEKLNIELYNVKEQGAWILN